MDEVISIEQPPQILDQTGNQKEIQNIQAYYTKINSPLFSKKIVETGMETAVTTTFMEKPILDRIPETLGTISSWVFPLFFLFKEELISLFLLTILFSLNMSSKSL
jgi:hypothetical protein